jgi:hypothetical protein
MWPLIIGAVSQGNKPILELGQEYQGGIIVKFAQPGEYGYVEGQQHGMIAAKEDVSVAQWGCAGSLAGTAAADSYGDGGNYTDIIINFHNGWTSPYEDPNNNGINATCSTLNNGEVQARNCREYNAGGFNDWFMPTYSDLVLLRSFDITYGSLNFTLANYWTSREHPSNGGAYRYNPVSGAGGSSAKTVRLRTRPCRYF